MIYLRENWQVMNSKICKIWISFIAITMFAGIVGLAILLGILLMPIFILTILIMSIREAITWRRKTRQSKPYSTIVVNRQEKAIIKKISPYTSKNKAA